MRTMQIRLTLTLTIAMKKPKYHPHHRSGVLEHIGTTEAKCSVHLVVAVEYDMSSVCYILLFSD